MGALLGPFGTLATGSNLSCPSAGAARSTFIVSYCAPQLHQVKEWKLNAERNNGRGAMMGIIGCMIHEGLTGNPIWPIDYEPGHFPLIPLETVWPGIFSMGNPYPTA